MENLLLNGLPVPLADIKDMDDCIIEEMNFKLSNEEIVNEWDTKIRRKMASKLSVCQNEKVFEDVLKDYLRLLREQARNFKEKKVLKDKISCHLKVFHLMCYSTREQVGLYMVNYLEYIENILIILCNLELEVIRQLRKNHVGKEYNKTVKRVARRLIDSLSMNLLNEEMRIFHVLLKLDYKHEQSWKDVMHIVYNHYLIKLPVRDRSDLSFCRYYLLFQKWKNITDKNKHQVMDKIMYLKFNKTPESITSNSVLKSILLPSTECLVDLVDVLTNGQQVTVNAYFKYIETRNEDQICLPDSIELDTDEDEDSTQNLLFAPSESEKRNNGLVKSEKHSKSPVQEQANYVEISSNNGQVVCVIDDDSDVEEVAVQDNKTKGRRQLGRKAAASRPVVSFLDSICLPEDSNPGSSPADENERATSPTPPAESTILPIVTAYIDSVRRRGIDTQETSTMGMESLSIRVDAQKEVAGLTDVLNNTVSCSENVLDSRLCTRTINKNIPSDSSHNKNNNSNSVVQDLCVISAVTSESSDNLISNEVQISNESEKCTCCCKHLTNTTNSSSNTITQSETNKSINKIVTKPNLKTVEIQTENMDSFNYLCGMITPPSDRTTDENSPPSMENTEEIHNNNSGNRNVYAYVPIVPREPYIENSSHNHYESDVETHSNNDSGVCESSTQVYNDDQPGNTQNQSESLLEEHSSTEIIQEQNSNLKEPRKNLISAQIEQSNQEEVIKLTETSTEEPINEIELTEEPASELQMNVIENVTEPEKQVNKNRFIEMELEEQQAIENRFSEIRIEEKQTDDNLFNETRVEEQANDNLFDEEPEQEINQNVLEETESEEIVNENDFNETCMEDSEDAESELEFNDDQIDDTELVSEIELHEDTLVEVLSEIGVSENENEQNQEKSELEHNKDTPETSNQENSYDDSITNAEDHQIINSIEENCASNEPEITVNSIINDSNYTDLSNVPIIITESQTTVFQESAIDVIPFDLINTVILGDQYVPDKEIVLIPTTDKDGGESTKFTVYKIATEVSEENFVDTCEINQVSNGNKSIPTEQNNVLNGKELLIVKDPNATVSEAHSCKIQASVTMTPLINKTGLKIPKNGKHVKMARKKNVEENVDKIIFTSNERVKSAPLSLFAKFEQSQSDLVENAFSGPIEPINGRANINCDNSNSNDSFCLFDSVTSIMPKDFKDNKSPSNSPGAEDSPISPPYENIHAQEYQNHILNVNLESLCRKEKSVMQKKSSTMTVESKHNSDTQNKFEIPSTTSIMSNKGASKRKRNDKRPVSKKLKVNFGHTEIRYIPRDQDKLLVNNSISRETYDEFNVASDLQLLYLEPQVVVKIDTSEDLKRRVHDLYVNSILNNLLFEKKTKAENSCIMTRVDYKKPLEDNLLKSKHVESPSYSGSAASSVPSAITKRVDAPRISGISPPSGYIPALNSPKPGLKRTSNCNQDNEDYGKYNSDSRVRTRRKRTLTPKAQKLPLLNKNKTSTKPSSNSTSQKRPRGRPKKSDTTKGSNNSNQGVLYSDGPFRLG